jgi:hypothetical protein
MPASVCILHVKNVIVVVVVLFSHRAYIHMLLESGVFWVESRRWCAARIFNMSLKNPWCADDKKAARMQCVSLGGFCLAAISLALRCRRNQAKIETVRAKTNSHAKL